MQISRVLPYQTDGGSGERSIVLRQTYGDICDVELLTNKLFSGISHPQCMSRKSTISELISYASLSDQIKSPFAKQKEPYASPDSSLYTGLKALSLDSSFSSRPLDIVHSNSISNHRCLSFPLEIENSFIAVPRDASPDPPYPDKYLQVSQWRVEDLSLLVGSDLAIFGTKSHPCITYEPINVFTGADMWLENIVNEVPEVAMCFHHEGIVMQEYELYKTHEIPELTGFPEREVSLIIKNIVMFLKRNATQEGHTYWLIKEPGLGLVKLYDLTELCNLDFQENRQHKTEDLNPFILPVAALCYKLAERRADKLFSRARRISCSNSESQTLKVSRKKSKHRIAASQKTCRESDIGGLYNDVLEDD
ncbi:unnamed protein product, partial [Protopolystoma xenopodis]